MLTFAIGDVHGCRDLLVALLADIDREADGRDRRIVCLGDYVDRGPDSAGVLALLRDRQAAAPQGRFVCLKGNHEELLLASSTRPDMLSLWLRNGGDATLASFGVASPERLPGEVVDWIARCPTSFDDGRRLFVHAGLNPAFDLRSQSDEDRLWIREAFLSVEHDFGRYVVHGHTPRRDGRPELRRWRVNIDTAAVYGGRLTAAVFEDGDDRPAGFLQVP